MTTPVPSLQRPPTPPDTRPARRRRRGAPALSLLSIVALSATGLVAPVLAAAPADAAPAAVREVSGTCMPAGADTLLDSGHVDMFNLSSNASGALTLDVKEDVTKLNTHRAPESVVLKVKDQALMDVPAGYPGAPRSWFLPQNQDMNLLWPGWDTLDVRAGGYDKAAFDVSYTGPEGGEISMFQMDGFSPKPISRLADGGFRLDPAGSTIPQDYAAHTHVNWAFSKAGRYTLTVTGRAQKSDGTWSSTSAHTYTIDVGDVPCASLPGASASPSPAASPSAPAAPTTAPAAPTTAPAPSAEPTTAPSAQPSAQPSSAPAPTSSAAPTTPADPGTGSTALKDPVTGADLLHHKHVDAGHIRWNAKKGTFEIGVIDGQTYRDASEVAVRLGPDAGADGREASRIKVPASGILSFLGKPGDILWNAPQEQIDDWRPVWTGLGASELPADFDKDSLYLTLDGVDGPGTVSVWRTVGSDPTEFLNSASTDKRTLSMPSGGHGHYNWSFTKPGRYQLHLTAQARKKDGTLVTSPDYTVTWLVGPDSAVGLPQGTTPTHTITTSAEDFPLGEAPAPTPGGGQDAGARGKDAQVPAGAQCLAPGHYDVATTNDGTGEAKGRPSVTITDGRTSHASQSVIVPVPDAYAETLSLNARNQALGSLGKDGQRIWSLPEAQDRKEVWLGLSSERFDFSHVTEDGLRTYLDGFEGPGRAVYWDSDLATGIRRLLDSEHSELKIVARTPTHKHVGVSFNQPGTYRAFLSLDVNYDEKDGWPAYKYRYYDLYYAVGNAAIEASCPGYLAQHGLGSAAKPEPAPSASAAPSPSAAPAPTASSRPTPSTTATPVLPLKPRPTTRPSAPAKPAPTTAPAAKGTAAQCTPNGVDTVIDAGHVDMFNVVSDAKGRTSMTLKEDVTGAHVTHAPESVLLKVKEQALQKALPEGVPGAGKPGYLLPQTQDPALLWPGWDTQGVAAGGYSRTDLDVRYTGPDGGRISMFLMAGLGGVQSRLTDGGYELKPSGSTIRQDYPAHTHVNWVFSKAGRYTLTVTARSSKADGTTATTVPHTYTIDVGHVDCAGAQAPAKGSTAPGARQGASPVAGPGAALAAAESARAGATGSTAGATGAQSAASDGSAGSSSAAGSGAAGQCTPTKVTREATKEEAAALSAKDGKGPKDGQAASGSAAPASSATSATTTLTLNVGPGATGNATEGHFDLGPAIIDGALVARVKDDRHQPAAWVDPASLTFALGDAAALKAPKDVSFVAKEGSTVWMIPSTQIPGVPWLGMNSQREEIVNGTTGEVSFRLDSVDGPGKVAVFAAGGLGAGVGQHVFDGAGSSYTLPANTHAHQNWLFTQPGTYHLTVTMSVTPKGGSLSGSGAGSAHEPGSAAARAAGGLKATGEKGPNGLPMVEETVGRTPDGRPCDLGDLAHTGTDPVAPLAASVLLGLAGAGLVAGRRRTLAHREQ
ncbi:hypothetical protein AXF14_05760 [Actinomyces radicidentis]|uniref:ABC transporter-associated repeat protein n=1 Tax=Actinomyces radicidentis TaxID=111015 RepID=A0A109W2I3_ACTRD|nr:TIGR03773 family transporter-associated surface protein [Actinomyces radicidentis]AMD87184.1 hypothetical protein AXF14_05760 [Actinomyces radicidentis]